MINYKSLETAGWLHIKNYLTAEEISAVSRDYANTKPISNNNYVIEIASRDLLLLLKNKINNTLEEVRLNTTLKPTFITPTAIYTNTATTDFDWHQDHEWWYMFQHNYHYLNFYLTIEKTYPGKSGLSIVPFDVLKKHAPAEIEEIIARGARMYFPEGNTTLVRDDDVGKQTILPVNIENIKISPELMPGDLLLLRGDMIHKTQDNDSHRLALAVRCSDGEHLISRDTFFNRTCEIKKSYIEGNKVLYDRYLSMFEKHGKTELTSYELVPLEDHL